MVGAHSRDDRDAVAALEDEMKGHATISMTESCETLAS